MLPADGALLVPVSFVAVCFSVARLVASSRGSSPDAVRRLRRGGALLSLLVSAAVCTAVGTPGHTAAWVGTVAPGLPTDVATTLGTLAVFLGPVPLAAYAAYRGADAGRSTPTGSPASFARGYALVVGPALLATALAPAVPDGWWLVVGVFVIGLTLAAGTPLFVRRLVSSRPLSPAERRALPDADLPVYVLRSEAVNALAAGVLPGLRCVFVTEALVDRLPPAELAAIVAHELGHHRRRHVPLRLGAVALFVLPWLGATARSVPDAFLAGLVLALPATLSIFRLVRWTEYDADAYASRRVGPDAMAGALRRLGPSTHRPPGLGGLLALHPPLSARIERLDRRVESSLPRSGPGTVPTGVERSRGFINPVADPEPMDGGSRQRVSDTLTRLTERYRGVEVNQTSIGVPAAVYDEVADGGHVDAHVTVRNESGELLVRVDENGESAPPNVQFEPGGALDDRLRTAFEQATGVACSIEDLLEVAIVTVYDRSDDDREPTYVLETHFTGAYEAGVARDGRFSWATEDAVSLSQ